MGQNGLSYIGPSLWNNLLGYLKKTTVLNTFKHNLKKKYLDNLAESQDLQNYYWYLLIFLTHLFIYLCIYYLFIYLFISVYLHTQFSFSFIQPFVFNFYFTYLPFPLPPLTVYFILFIMHPFRYLFMFLTCSYLCYNIII